MMAFSLFAISVWKEKKRIGFNCGTIISLLLLKSEPEGLIRINVNTFAAFKVDDASGL
jgi:hypothetical protein